MTTTTSQMAHRLAKALLGQGTFDCQPPLVRLAAVNLALQHLRSLGVQRARHSPYHFTR